MNRVGDTTWAKNLAHLIEKDPHFLNKQDDRFSREIAELYIKGNLSEEERDQIEAEIAGSKRFRKIYRKVLRGLSK